MAREITLTVPGELTDGLVDELRKLEGVAGVALQRGGSVEPAGDIVTVTATGEGLHESLRIAGRLDLHRHEGVTIRTSDLLSLVAPGNERATMRGASNLTWEEIERLMAAESNMTINGMILMFAAGALAAAGIAQNAVHVVIGAMAVAPGFMPVMRTIFGAVVRNDAWKHGLADTAKGYAALVAGAAVTALLFAAWGVDPLGDKPTYLASGTLTEYWTTISPVSLLASSVAALAGLVLVVTNRSVLTSGAMIALALVPTAALVGIAAVGGAWDLAGRAALRWGIDVALVAGAAVAVLLWKRATVHRRDSLLRPAREG
jgi:hypothetical protein